jgi:hypothetical protein
MKILIPMRQALADDRLLGKAMPGPSWSGWHALLIALTGAKLTDAERADFKRLTLRDREPADGRLCEAFLAIAGRRGGKTKAMATHGVWLATCCDWSDNLSLGERGRIMFVAPGMDQARVQMEYCSEIFRASPKLQAAIKNETVDQIELINRITLEVTAASAARSRGFTAVAICLDESCFLKSGDAVDSDTDLLTALRPSLMTTRGPMLLTSTPGAPLGMAHSLFKRHYKPDGSPRCLVAHGGTLDFNPSIEQSVIDQAYEDDPEAAEAEIGGKFRSPLSSYLTRAVIERAIDRNIVPQHRRLPGIRYRIYSDMATGAGRDSATMAVAHTVRDGDHDLTIFDELLEQRPPFDPLAVVRRMCEIAKFWGCTEISGDQYGRPFVSLFAKHGVNYVVSPLSTSEVYLHSRLSWTAGNVVLPLFETTTERAIEQFLTLRRKVAPGGRETVEHIGSKHVHDDLAVAISGAIYLCTPPDYGGAASMSFGGIGVFTAAPGGPVHGPDGSNTPRTPQLGDPYQPEDEADRQRLEHAKELRAKARMTAGEAPPQQYRGLLW